MLLQQFMQRTGSGSWINGYIIMQLQPHRFYLCSKHYVDSICKHADLLGEAPLNSVEFENSIAPSAVVSSSSSFSSPVDTKINEILRDTAIRVVELREHPLGANGLVLVLECIHNQNWAANQRFVGLDVYQFYSAIQSNERVPLSKHSAMIPLLSQNVRSIEQPSVSCMNHHDSSYNYLLQLLLTFNGMAWYGMAGVGEAVGRTSSCYSSSSSDESDPLLRAGVDVQTGKQQQQ